MIHNRNVAHLNLQDYANRYSRSQIKVLFQITRGFFFFAPMPVGATSIENGCLKTACSAYGDEIISNSCATYRFAHSQTRSHPAKYLPVPSGRYSGREGAFAKARFLFDLCPTQIRTVFGLPSKLFHKSQHSQMVPCETV